MSEISPDLDVAAATYGSRYRLTRVLKTGDGVDTALGTDIVRDIPVIVKTTDARMVSAEARIRLEHEAAILSRLESPWLAPVIEVGYQADVLYVVMPYVEGVTLEERLRSGALPVADALAVAGCLLGGLAYVHANGVLHCDVKPANVVVNCGSPLDHATLIDFGMARTPALGVTLRDRRAGTARYMAPEQAGLLDRTVDERADLYSAGIVLFECLAGRPPFTADTIGEVLRQSLSTPPPPLRSLGAAVPGALEEIVQRLLRKDPDDRYRSAGAALADLEAVGDAMRRGIQEPIIVVGAHDSRETLAEPALIGRERELGVLDRHLEDTRQGAGGLVILEAGSGGGKTRLLDEFAQRAAGSGALVLRGQGVEHAAPRPLQILAGIIADLVAEAQTTPGVAEGIDQRVGDARNQLFQVLPELRDAFAPGSGPAGPEAYAQTRTVAALVGLLDALGSSERPAVVVLDDCQWADEVTPRVLAAWARGTPNRSRARHTLVVAAARPEELDADWPLRGLRGVPCLELEPLAPGQVRQVLESMAGSVPPEAAQTVIELSAGNPFMVSAVLRGLVEAGDLANGDSGWQFQPGPAGRQASREAAAFLARRLELLDPSTRSVLDAGAVLGREFDLGLAGALAGQERSETESAISQAVARHIVWRHQGHLCSFVHDRLRETFLFALDPADLASLHRRAAEQIEAADPARTFELAYHFDAAGRPGQALPYALESGKAARARHDLELAERQYGIAERAWTEADHRTRQEVAEALGQLAMLRGRYDEADAHFQRALTLSADEVSTARIQGELGELAFKRDHVEAAAERLEVALGTLSERVPGGRLSLVTLVGRELLLRVAGRLGWRRRRRAGLTDEADERERLTAHLLARLQYVWWFKRSRLATVWVMLRHLNVAERASEGPELAHTYAIHGAGMALTFPFLSRRGLRFVDRSLALHQRHGNLLGEGQAWSMRGSALHAAGRFADAIEAYDRGVRLLEQHGDPWELNFAGWNRALCLYRLGRLREAVEQARQTHGAGVEVGDAQAEAIALEIWAKATGGHVGPQAVQAALHHGADIHSGAAALQAEALRLRHEGKLEQAVAFMERAASTVYESRSRNIFVASVFPWLATMYREAAEQTSGPDRSALRRKARVATRRALRQSRLYRNDRPHALREAAMVAALAGRRRRARRLFHRCTELAVRHDAPAEHGETVRQRARLAIPVGWREGRDGLATAVMGMEDVDRIGRQPTLGLAERFDTLLAAGGQLASAASSEEIAAAIRETALTLLRAEHCAVVGVGSGAERQPRSETDPHQFLGRDLGARAMSQRRPVVLTEVSAGDAGASDSAVLAGVRSALCAPILVRDHVVGYFVASHSKVDSLFGEEEERLAEFIAHLAGAALERERFQHEMRAGVVAAQEAERARVARDLHDEIGQALTSVLLGVRLVESSVQEPAFDLAVLLTRISELRQAAGEALMEVQRLAFELRPTVLDDLGLVPALRRLVGDMGSRQGISVQLETGELGHGARLPADVETTVYRVVQEALTNVVRHSGASTCSVVLARARGHLRVVVEDDGVGFESSDQSMRGLGLRGMTERAVLVHGTLRVTSRPGEGTAVLLEIPDD